MIHHMKLNDKPFNSILNGTKRIELRLFDKKRSKICINDYIVFTNTTDISRTLKVQVTSLLHYNTFEDLFNDIDFNISGLASSLQEKLDSIHKIYSLEQEKEFGVLGIGIKKMDEK